MSLRIRMARGGAKKRPFYRIVVADARSPRDGRYIEKIGIHNPMVPKDHDERLRLDVERAKYWMSVGASPSPRVHKFLAEMGVLEKPAVPANQTKKHLPKAKAQERMREAEEARKAAEEAAAAEAAAAEEAPAEEAPAEEPAADEAAEA